MRHLFRVAAIVVGVLAIGAGSASAAHRIAVVDAGLAPGLPVVGAEVAVVGLDGTPLSAPTLLRDTRTTPAGVAVLDASSLPDDFAVLVRGGTVGGRATGTTLAAIVRGHRPERVIGVTLPTTVAYRVHRARPDRGVDAARRAARHAFGMAGWANLGREPRVSRHVSSRRRVEQAIAERGSLAALVRQATRMATTGEGRLRLGQPRTADRYAPDRILGDVAGGPQSRQVATVATFVFRNLAAGALSGIGSVAMQRLLKVFGITAQPSQTQELQQIQSQLSGISSGLATLQQQDSDLQAQLQTDFTALTQTIQADATALQQEGFTALQAQNVNAAAQAQIAYGTAYADAVAASACTTALGNVSTILDLLSGLAGVAQTGQGSPQIGALIASEIRADLLSVPSQCTNDLLGSEGAAGMLQLAWNQLTGGTQPIVTAQAQQALEAIVDQYAGQQSAAAVLLANYYGYAGFTQSWVQTWAAGFQTRVQNQLAVLPDDAVPSGTAVDARSGLMWLSQTQGFGLPVQFTPDGSGGMPFGYEWSISFGTTPPGGFEDWQVPVVSQVSGLIRAATSPQWQWLARQAPGVFTTAVGAPGDAYDFPLVAAPVIVTQTPATVTMVLNGSPSSLPGYAFVRADGTAPGTTTYTWPSQNACGGGACAWTMAGGDGIPFRASDAVAIMALVRQPVTGQEQYLPRFG